MGAILVVLALGLTFRLIIAYLLPGSGFDSDLSSFRAWAINLFDEGLYGFYERDFFHDYTPGYLYVLWLVGAVASATGGVGDLIKIPPILADLGIAWLVWSMVRELGGRERLALLAAAAVVVNPVFWFDSVVWGQVDSFGVLFLLLALRELWRDHPERSAILTVVAALIKPQLGILIPLVAVVTIRRALWPIDRPIDTSEVGAGADGDGAGWRDRLRAWEARTGSWTRILTTGAAGYLTAVVLCLPFGLSVLVPQAEPPFFSSGLIEQIVLAGGGYPFLTVNAYNGWAMVPGDLGNSLANAGVWICDAVIADASRCTAGTATFGPIPAVAVGAALLVATIIGVLIVAARRPDRLTLLVALTVLAIAFFAAPTRVHERYGFPFFALGAILFAISLRWRIAYVVMSAATFANMYVVLTTLYPPADPSTNPVVDWLGIGASLRSEAAVVTMAVLHTAVFVWAIAQLRRGAHERLTDELAEAGREPPSVADRAPAIAAPGAATDAPVATSVAPAGAVAGARYRLPTWLERRSAGEVGWTRWFRDRLADMPYRADRSRTLMGERGGRFDRLDVWFMVVLIALTLGVRTFRLAEPTMMKFDEVYHARTAAEFLQHWRYGESHDIYEWTHPHLAKYAMAVGLMVFGENEVSATSDLGVTVRGAAIEPRREDILFEGSAGERVHIATGDEIRTYDLRSREFVSVMAAAGASAVAVDAANGLLIVGSDAGSIATIELDIIGVGGVDTGMEPAPLTDLDHPVERLLVSADGGTVLAASGERLSAVDIATGTVRGVVDLPGIADLAQAGTGAALVGTPSAMGDPEVVADTLAELLDGDRDTYLTIITGATDPDAEVVLGAPGTGDDRTALDEAITDGRLAGVEVVDLPRVAVATDAGVAFLDPATARVSSTVGLVGGAHGLAYVTGLDDPKLYVTTGTEADPAYEIVTVGGDAAAGGPVAAGHHPLPALGSRVAYDDAAQMVHILGATPQARDGGVGWTVYQIEPHGNAVFSDTALPEGLVPSAWAMDVESQYPTEDRRELLVLGQDGATAAVPVSTAAFAWRMPGVIAGVLMGLCLYVLARILFARRSVALIVGALVLLDGMFFTQSRIGMNDVYVGLFIMAAYTVFAAVWTGWWRGRGAFWIAMPVIGLLLGLALASKWVAAYAVGALVLLLLVRSALGRVVAILGLIGITSVLGYMAIAVAEGQGLGNLPFLALMVGLTLLAVVVAINHPIAWTDEEVWVAIGAPAVVAVLVFFGALSVGQLDTVIAIGPLAITPLLAAIAFAIGALGVAAAFHVGGRLGYGPFAGAPAPDDPARLLPPPAEPPDGWLRPGTMLGLPLVWAAACLAVIPLGVYIVSYIPWALIGDHQLWTGVPAGHSGQTLLDLTGQMYRYHDGLTSPHAASSPWWAWPFDLKPVWFYQDSFAAATTAAEYGAGNLVIWWMGVPALAFVAYMAYRRRSLALALIAIGFAGQWVPWARIDRAAFQYHYFTALPFVLLSLAYFIAELWHGAARRTWLVARVAAGIAIVAPALMWLFLRPICALVGVESVNPGSRACPAVIPDAVLTYRVAGLIVVAIVGAVILGRAVLALGRADEATGKVPGFRSLLLPGLVVAVGFFMVAFLPDTPIFEVDGVPVEPIALIVLVPLSYLAAQVVAARDARRFVGGLLVAAAAWFAIWYPNIAALPLPTAVVNAYQGLLPTYLYEFQFPVGAQEGAADSSLFTPTLAILASAIVLTCLAVAYSASVWRLANAESAAAAASGADPTATGSDDGAGGLARTGGA